MTAVTAMMDHYLQLDDACLDEAQAIHNAIDLALEPIDREARSVARVTAASRYRADHSIFAYTHSVQMRLHSLRETENVWLSLPVECGPSGHFLARQPLERARLAVPGRADFVHVQPREQRFGLALGADAIKAFAARYLENATIDISSFGEFDATYAPHRHVAGLLIGMVEAETERPGVLDNPRVSASYLQPIMMLMASGAFEGDAPSPGLLTRDVKRACDYINAHLAEPISLGDLADVAEVPVRTLCAHFVSCLGQSPIAYLRERRLDRANELLCAGRSGNVTDAAMAVGITHFGRFSEAYRKRFGEAPSRSLARAKARFN